MAEYMCKQFDFNSLVKCSFSLSDSELKIFLELMECNDPICIVALSKKIKRDRSTIQKVIKILLEKELVVKKKINLEDGGYMFYYSPKSKSDLKKQMLKLVGVWYNNVKKEIMKW